MLFFDEFMPFNNASNDNDIDNENTDSSWACCSCVVRLDFVRKGQRPDTPGQL